MTIYVDSAATGANNGTSWTDAYTSIASATGAAAGETILVDDGHNDSALASGINTFTNGAIGAPVKIISVDKADDSYSAGASFGSTSTLDVRFAGSFFMAGCSILGNRYAGSTPIDGIRTWYQCTFTRGTDGAGFFYVSDGGSATNGTNLFEECSFIFGTTAAAHIRFGGGKAVFKNCTVDLSSVVGTLTRLLYYEAARQHADVLFLSCNLLSSGTGSYTTLLEIFGSNASPGKFVFQKCKIPGSGLVSHNNSDDTSVIFDACSSSSTITDPPLQNIYHYQGTSLCDLTRYRTGGADDGENANAYSVEMATNANATELYAPLIGPPLQRWIAPDASISGATPVGLTQSTRCLPQATPAALTTDSGSTWNGSGVGTKQKITVTVGDYTATIYVASGVTLNNDDFWVEVFAPDQVGGVLTIVPHLAKPSTTVYVDPKIEVA